MCTQLEKEILIANSRNELDYAELLLDIVDEQVPVFDIDSYFIDLHTKIYMVQKVSSS